MLEGLDARLMLAQGDALNHAGCDYDDYVDALESPAWRISFDIGFASVLKNEQTPPHMIATNPTLAEAWKEGREVFMVNPSFLPISANGSMESVR